MVSRLADESLDAVLLPVGGGQTPGVSLGVPAARLLLDDDAALHYALADGAKRLAELGRQSAQNGGKICPQLVDQAGHHRDVYWPLVLHLHLSAFTLQYESLPSSLWSVCEDALADAIIPTRWIESFVGVAPAADQTAMALWSALCLLEQAVLASRDVDIELVDTVVHHMVARPGSEGALHPRNEQAGGEESLDAWTYRELCGLHALANLAIARRNQTWAKRVEQIALYHLENTQPDNTTNQPWALFAFLWSPQTRSFGEQQMHDATVHRDQCGGASRRIFRGNFRGWGHCWPAPGRRRGDAGAA